MGFRWDPGAFGRSVKRAAAAEGRTLKRGATVIVTGRHPLVRPSLEVASGVVGGTRVVGSVGQFAVKGAKNVGFLSALWKGGSKAGARAAAVAGGRSAVKNEAKFATRPVLRTAGIVGGTTVAGGAAIGLVGPFAGRGLSRLGEGFGGGAAATGQGIGAGVGQAVAEVGKGLAQAAIPLLVVGGAGVLAYKAIQTTPKRRR